MEQVEQIRYVITGRKSSLGINIWQLTIILAAVMVVCVVTVGIIMYVRLKRKLKKGYVPDMSYADENE